MSMEEFKKAVDAASVEILRQDRRGHLGPSQLGGKCLREPFYSFRQVTPDTDPNAAMKRLTNRGHEEEHRVVKWLRGVDGVEIRDYSQRLMYHDGRDSYVCVNWDDDDVYAWAECDDVSDDPVHIQRASARGEGPKQWGFSTHGGHHKGGCDGKITGLAKWFSEATGWGLLECKTSNEKSFVKLAGKKGKWNFKKGGLEPREFDVSKNGLWRAKSEHFKQMQQYMHQLKLRWGLYVAVNKDTDEIYYELVKALPEWGERLSDNAKKIIESRFPPHRQSEDPSYFGCGLCKHKEVCHYGVAPDKSCRSCVFVEAVTERPGARWFCYKYRQDVPEDFVSKGCSEWEGLL